MSQYMTAIFLNLVARDVNYILSLGVKSLLPCKIGFTQRIMKFIIQNDNFIVISIIIIIFTILLVFLMLFYYVQFPQLKLDV